MKTIVVDRKMKIKELPVSNHPKIAILGVSGSGKTTIAMKIAGKYGIEHLELDSLFLNENWRESNNEEFRKKIGNRIRNTDGFIIDGNYSNVSDLTWDKCELFICLDYSRLVIMKRIILRTIKRVITKEKLWNGNKESFKRSFLSRESIILWSWNTYEMRKKDYMKIAEKYKNEDKIMMIVKDSRALKAFID